MSATVLYMSNFLDGFVAGPNEGRDNDEVMATGALVTGRTTFEPAGGWGGDHHNGQHAEGAKDLKEIVTCPRSTDTSSRSHPCGMRLASVSTRRHLFPARLAGGVRLEPLHQVRDRTRTCTTCSSSDGPENLMRPTSKTRSKAPIEPENPR